MLLSLTPRDLRPLRSYRAVKRDDVQALATLMYHAYQGAIDNDGETVEEAVNDIERTFEGEYGRFMDGDSFVIEEGDRLLSATLVTWWEEAPLLAFVMTHPDAKGTGMGRYLIERSINALLADGHDRLILFVTEGNTPAQHLYDKLGFHVVERH
jgi:GNAT superfamily N-acetyltransferase